MYVMGEMKERYGRDKNNLFRAESPLAKGIPEDDGRDGDYFRPKSAGTSPHFDVSLLTNFNQMKVCWHFLLLLYKKVECYSGSPANNQRDFLFFGLLVFCHFAGVFNGNGTAVRVLAFTDVFCA